MIYMYVLVYCMYRYIKEIIAVSEFSLDLKFYGLASTSDGRTTVHTIYYLLL